MNIKQIEILAAIFLGCALGSIILQFAAPILLVILVSGASLTVLSPVCKKGVENPPGEGKGRQCYTKRGRN